MIIVFLVSGRLFTPLSEPWPVFSQIKIISSPLLRPFPIPPAAYAACRYVGVDACFLVPLPGRDGLGHVVEFELTLDGVDAAKGQLHSRYDQYEPFVSRVLPERLAGSAAAAFVARRLRNSGLDAVVDCLARKAGGVFSYAKLLADHVDLAGADLDDLHGLPNGLDNIHAHLATLANPAQRVALRNALPRPETAEDDGAEEEQEEEV